MSYLLLLVIFWKPMYHVVMYFYKKDASYLTEAKNWFSSLFDLVRPT